uniref:Uncharacterized protein n=1 Tax=Arundo donax TaxID=35708 RepID=A0A0A8YZ29_ARUDO
MRSRSGPREASWHASRWSSRALARHWSTRMADLARHRGTHDGGARVAPGGGGARMRQRLSLRRVGAWATELVRRQACVVVAEPPQKWSMGGGGGCGCEAVSTRSAPALRSLALRRRPR